MKSKLSIFVVTFGFLIFFTYIFFDRAYHGEWITEHFFSISRPLETILNIVVICAFIGSVIAGYLINERKKLLELTKISETQLKHAAHEWSATFDSMPYGVFLTDTDRNIIRANQLIANLSGIPARALVFREKCYANICRKDSPHDACPLQKVLKTKKTESYEYFDDEHSKFFTESISPMFNSEGNLNSYVHVLVDVTDAKEKENKLIKSKDAFFNMLKDIDSTYKELRGVYDSLIVTFSNIIDAKSSWTRGHSLEVANYATAIARKMNLNELEVETLKTAALLHDIGKIGAYDVILNKPGKLNEGEFIYISKHPVKGEDILKPIKGFKNILPIVRSHHEKMDGTGYPDNLRGDEIPFLARILCVADSYDAMMSDRPYRPACGLEYAVSELRKCSGTHFDPEVVDAFLKTLPLNEMPSA